MTLSPGKGQSDVIQPATRRGQGGGSRRETPSWAALAAGSGDWPGAQTQQLAGADRSVRRPEPPRQVPAAWPPRSGAGQGLCGLTLCGIYISGCWSWPTTVQTRQQVPGHAAEGHRALTEQRPAGRRLSSPSPLVVTAQSYCHAAGTSFKPGASHTRAACFLRMNK